MTEKNNKIAFHKLLMKNRIKIGLSQQELVDKVNSTRTSINYYENCIS